MSELNFNMAGFGFNFEGPISEKGSYMFALKRSFLDFVIQQSGLLAIPKYWTGQGKLTHNFSPTRKLSLNVIGGIDAINIEGEDDPQLRGADNVEYNSNQLTLGLTYKDLFSIKGYSILSLSTSSLGMNTDVYKILENGDRSSYYNQDDSEWETTLKGDLVYRLAPEMEVSTGFNVKAIHLDYDNWVEVSPRKVYGYALQAGEPVHSISTEDYYANYFQNPDLIIETIAVYSELDTVVTESILGFWKTGIYSQLSLKPIPSIELNMGLRHESISYTKEGNFPPRLGFSFQFSPRMKFNLSAGRYYQSPFNIHLNTKRGQPEKLKNYFTDQGVLGLEYFLSADTRATLEVFSKEYEDIIGFEILSDASGRDSLNNNNLINSGKGSSRGLELYIQKKYSKNWYGSLAWSHSVAEGVDPRTEKYYPWNYDYRDVINLVGGYKIRYEEFDWYRRYKKTVWAKSLSWLPFMPLDEYEISFRFRYMGGRPYTPKTYDPNIREWVVNSDQSWNSERYDPYIRFDIMIQQRFNFRRMNMVAFWDILNVFNKDNPWEYVYLVDGSKKMAWQYKTFPVGGLILEF